MVRLTILYELYYWLVKNSYVHKMNIAKEDVKYAHVKRSWCERLVIEGKMRGRDRSKKYKGEVKRKYMTQLQVTEDITLDSRSEGVDYG
ncbi:hypothetical protein H5410_015774 [Solanum commersonii]|uniref:Uncharacterized protein n=1 Tax=Solanum commersonii TaxID=4109 RepID=A0A9J5ZUL3_SOLCO|nr:hypothetical protein H5410_015774 [Solanum commersonii]